MSWTTRTRPLKPEHQAAMLEVLDPNIVTTIPADRIQRWLRVAMGDLPRFKSEAAFYQSSLNHRRDGHEVSLTVTTNYIDRLTALVLPPQTDENFDDENAYEDEGIVTVVVRRRDQNAIADLTHAAKAAGLGINTVPPFGNQQAGSKMPLKPAPKEKAAPVQQVAKATRQKADEPAYADVVDPPVSKAARKAAALDPSEPKKVKAPAAPKAPRSKDRYQLRAGADVTGLKRLRLKIVEALQAGPLTSDEIIATTGLNGNSVRFNLGNPLAQWVEKVKA